VNNNLLAKPVNGSCRACSAMVAVSRRFSNSTMNWRMRVTTTIRNPATRKGLSVCPDHRNPTPTTAATAVGTYGNQKGNLDTSPEWLGICNVGAVVAANAAAPINTMPVDHPMTRASVIRTP